MAEEAKYFRDSASLLARIASLAPSEKSYWTCRVLVRLKLSLGEILSELESCRVRAPNLDFPPRCQAPCFRNQAGQVSDKNDELPTYTVSGGCWAAVLSVNQAIQSTTTKCTTACWRPDALHYGSDGRLKLPARYITAADKTDWWLEDMSVYVNCRGL